MDSIREIGVKTIYQAEGREASEWVREPVKGVETFDAPQMKSGLNVGQDGRGTMAKGSLLYLTTGGNSLVHSQTNVFLTSSCSSMAHGLSVMEGEGWRRAIALYAARKLVGSTWITQKDEYLVPNTYKRGLTMSKWILNKDHPLTPAYEQWVDDCHIHALVYRKNNCTSMRGVDYKGKKWNIHNHFFWLTRQEALDLYKAHGADFLVQDALDNPIKPLLSDDEEPSQDDGGFFFELEPKSDKPLWVQNGDPYLASVLPSLKLSDLAKEVLSDLKALHTACIGLRRNADPALHLNSWDAGVYQLNKLLKGTPEHEAFRAKCRELSKHLEHGVYTFGFLKG